MDCATTLATNVVQALVDVAGQPWNLTHKLPTWHIKQVLDLFDIDGPAISMFLSDVVCCYCIYQVYPVRSKNTYIVINKRHQLQ
jgi:hypothetical protein